MQVVLVYLEWFGAIQSLNVYCSLKSLKKITKNPHVWGSRSFKVIDVGAAGKLVSCASVGLLILGYWTLG